MLRYLVVTRVPDRLDPGNLAGRVMHTCPAPGCGRGLQAANDFACRRHWHQLPPDVKRRVSAAWARIRAGDHGGFDAHRAAAAEARVVWGALAGTAS